MDMTRLAVSALVLTALLAGAANAQTTTTTAPGSENSQTSQQATPPAHNNMLPAVPKPGKPHKRFHVATSANNTAPSNSPSSSANTPARTLPNPNPDATPSGPDQGKPGNQTRPQDNNTTNVHTPGSENPADTGPTAPKA
jgi:hypothetical protein